MKISIWMRKWTYCSRCDHNMVWWSVSCSYVSCLERWYGWRDWPKILHECVWIWCGEELWVSDPGESPWLAILFHKLCFSPIFLFIFTPFQGKPHLLSFSESCYPAISLSYPSLVTSLSHLTRFFLFCSADAWGRVHTVCHDSWDQAELDRGFKKEHPAQQLARPHTVIQNISLLNIWKLCCKFSELNEWR